MFDALHHGLVYLASRRRDTETIGGGQLLIEFLGLMAVVWCDTFVSLTIDGGQPGGNKICKTKTKKKTHCARNKKLRHEMD